MLNQSLFNNIFVFTTVVLLCYMNIMIRMWEEDFYLIFKAYD
jgi:hypothetical protein